MRLARACTASSSRVTRARKMSRTSAGSTDETNTPRHGSRRNSRCRIVLECATGVTNKEVAADLDVHLICDNASTHKTPAIQRWLTTHPRFHVHFTPTSSPWLNQVERWFALLTAKQIRRGIHKKHPGPGEGHPHLDQDWNDDPKPFVRTKTADEILQLLAGYLNRINNSGR